MGAVSPISQARLSHRRYEFGSEKRGREKHYSNWGERERQRVRERERERGRGRERDREGERGLPDTVKICRHLTTKILTTFSSEENDDKPLSVDDTFVICDDRFVT